jgi:pimeloyl-ACP methyl ester carboxylesterase
MRFGLLCLAAALVMGCSELPRDPSFPVSYRQASDAMSEMRHAPKPLARPLVVIGGFGDPNISPPLFAHCFRDLTGPGKIIRVSVGFCGSFEACRAKVIEAVQKACPSDDPNWTTEVDVVGASLGGVVARYAAAPPPEGTPQRRLKVARLFSISSPHDGAELAEHIALTQFHRDLRPNSPFMQRLATFDADVKYELIPYVHLGDDIVGAEHAAPPGQSPYWLPGPPILSEHASAMMDPRILADIARHLRGEEPFIRPPASPLPSVAQAQ